jgi:hypothetical protein
VRRSKRAPFLASVKEVFSDPPDTNSVIFLKTNVCNYKAIIMEAKLHLLITKGRIYIGMPQLRK